MSHRSFIFPYLSNIGDASRAKTLDVNNEPAKLRRKDQQPHNEQAFNALGDTLKWIITFIMLMWCQEYSYDEEKFFIQVSEAIIITNWILFLFPIVSTQMVTA